MPNTNFPQRGYILNASKKQINKLLILYILLNENRPLYGKEINVLLNRYGFLTKDELPTHGSLYPLLHEMFEEGLLKRKERLLNPEKMLDDGDRPYQKVVEYEVTDLGKKEFEILKKKFISFFQRQSDFLETVYRRIYDH